MTRPLEWVRVVDMTSPRGDMAGRILADLGAEVIKVEPPGGTAARHLAPFDEKDSTKSLYWEYVGRGKKSVVLRLDDPASSKQFLRLIERADIFLESEEPGALDRLGFGYNSLRAVNPGLIHVSITPYGQTGPTSHAPATDLTIEAVSGFLELSGDRDRPPVPVGFPQASMQAGAQAAADALIALYGRETGGKGQYLDVSMQACMAWMTLTAPGWVALNGVDPPNSGASRDTAPREMMPGIMLPRIFQCADGFTYASMQLGEVGARSAAGIMSWVAEEGALDADLAARNWMTWIPDVQAGRLSAADFNRAVTQLTRFIAGKTKLELMKRAVDGRLMIAPLYSMADILDDRQLASRDYWETVGGVRHPGPFARLTQTPISGTAAAPQLGADQAILAPAPAAERRPVRGGRTSRSPFDGLKVADFAWSAAGPLISKALADHGATVVHIESETRVDYLRLVPPYKDDIPGVNRNHIFTNYNTSKLSLALNLATDRGRHIARKMADWADVVVESFIPGVMERHGLSYRELSANHPNLVMISSTLRGQTGPEKLYSGFGGQGGALAGFEAITGWPDRAPCGVWGAYTDLVSPRPGVAALTAALLHRLRTGQGQYIDLSQVESSLHILGPVVLDYSVNGRVWGLRGQDSPYACPQGVYQAAGDQRFVAIAVESPDQWRALVKTANLGFTGSEFEQESVRRLHDGPVAAELRAWCVERDAFEMAEMLRAAGVPASPVLRMTDVYRDPQLWGRGHFITLDHGELGPTIHEGLATKFSKHGDSPLSAGPTLGQHTNHVLRDLLGLSEHEIADCAAAGALQ